MTLEYHTPNRTPNYSWFKAWGSRKMKDAYELRLVTEHDDGDHDRPVKDCPLCKESR